MKKSKEPVAGEGLFYRNSCLADFLVIILVCAERL